MNISNKDKLLILQKAAEIPPLSWLPANPTEDQYLHWQNTKLVYGKLHDELLDFFSGKASSLKDNLPADIADLIKLQAKVYIDLYTVIRDGWSVIQDWLEIFSRDSNLEGTLKHTVQVARQAKSPGDLLARIIEADCQYHFNQCKQYSEVRPRRTEALIRESIRVERLKAGSEPSKSELRQIVNYEKKMRKQADLARRERPGLIGLCLAICKVYVRSHKDEALQISLKRYQAMENQKLRILQPHFHPQKKNRGYNWMNGRIVPL